MAVMILLAVAHSAFWAWALMLGVGAGLVGGAGAALVVLWLVLLGAWAVFVGRLARSGWLAGPGITTWPAFWVSGPAVTLSLLALILLPTFREAFVGSLGLLPATTIPMLNALRILAVGTVVKAARGQLPKRIGLGVGIPDMSFGVWSLVIAVNGGFASTEAAVAWHAVGAGILLLMIPAVFTALRQPRLDAPGKGDARAILRFPLVLAPAGLALPFLILHAVVIGVYLATGTLVGRIAES